MILMRLVPLQLLALILICPTDVLEPVYNGIVNVPNVYAPLTPVSATGVPPLNIVDAPSDCAYVKFVLLITFPEPSDSVPGSTSTGELVSLYACPVKFATVAPAIVTLGEPEL